MHASLATAPCTVIIGSAALTWNSHDAAYIKAPPLPQLQHHHPNAMKRRIRCTATSGNKSHCRRLFTDVPHTDLCSPTTSKHGQLNSINTNPLFARSNYRGNHAAPRAGINAAAHTNNAALYMSVTDEISRSYTFNRAPHYMIKRTPAHAAAPAWSMHMCV